MSHEEGIKAAMYSIQIPIGFGEAKIRAEQVIQAYLSASNQVLAPMEPTKRMLVAGVRGEDISETAYRYKAMLSFAPNPFTQAILADKEES